MIKEGFFDCAMLCNRIFIFGNSYARYIFEIVDKRFRIVVTYILGKLFCGIVFRKNEPLRFFDSKRIEFFHDSHIECSLEQSFQVHNRNLQKIGKTSNGKIIFIMRFKIGHSFTNINIFRR